MVLGRRWSGLAAALAAVCSATTIAVSQSPVGTPELPAGGLVLVANGSILPEQLDVTIAVDRVRLVYVFRNADERDASMLVTFALPDLDMTWIWDQPPLLPRSGDANFVEATTSADGVRVAYRLEQRALALGLDVTQALTQQGIPLFPYETGLHDRIRDLPEPVREDFLARGILKAASDKLLPSWLLKSTLHWRQLFPAGKPVTLVHSYSPVAGSPAGTLAALEKSTCLDAADARRLELAAKNAGHPRLTVVGYQSTAGSAWSDAIGRFRLTIDKPSPTAQVVLCRTGLSTVSPTQLEWMQRDYAIEDDITVLFVD